MNARTLLVRSLLLFVAAGSNCSPTIAAGVRAHSSVTRVSSGDRSSALARDAADASAGLASASEQASLAALPLSLPRSINEFGFTVFATMERSQNTVFSPFDVSRALALLEHASSGEAREEIHRLPLFQHGPRALASLSALAGIFERSARRPGFALSSAERAWPSNSLGVVDSFRDAVVLQVGASLVALDYASDPEAQRRAINAWGSERTGGRVPEIMTAGSVRSDTRFVLTSVTGFRGRWRSAFERSRTADREFFVSATQAKTVPMMRAPVFAMYAEDADARMLELAYEGDEFVFDVILPPAGRGLGTLLPRLNEARMASWMYSARPRSIIVELPRFSLQRRVALRSTLELLGVRSVFSSTADLGRMTTSAVASVDAVLHEVSVSVAESETEAESSAVASSADSASLPVFSIHQPFVFAVRHRPTGVVLLLGSVADPAPDAPTHAATGSPFVAGALDPAVLSSNGAALGPGRREPFVRDGAPTVRGALSTDAVRRVLARARGAVMQCYERGLVVNPALRGVIRVAFAIDANGVARGVTVDDALPAAEVRGCVRRAFESLQFPRPEGASVLVEVPLELLPFS